MLRGNFLEEPLDTWVARRDEVELPCSPPEGHPPPQVTWRKDGGTLNLTEERHERVRLAGNGLVITKAELSDEGRYQCVARNLAGSRHSHEALLSVYVKPFLVKAPENVSSDAGATVRFACTAEGVPRPQVSWVRPGGKLVPGRVEVEDGAVLRIRGVASTDSGEYRCRAENIAGAVTASVFLQIQTPPVFLVEPEDKIIKPGTRVTLDCRLEEQSPPVFQFWLKEGEASPLLPGTEGRLGVSGQGSLTIEPVSNRYSFAIAFTTKRYGLTIYHGIIRHNITLAHAFDRYGLNIALMTS